MPVFKPTKSEVKTKIEAGIQISALKSARFDAFNSSLLGLGDIKTPSVPTDSIAALFDLEGFTNFSKQIEPHLSVPLFLSEFLSWLIDAIKKETKHSDSEDGVILYGPLPFFLKFMGDGLLVLWDVTNTNHVGHRNIILSTKIICENYKSDFLPKMKKKVVEPPPVLRCGLARGAVYSVGNGNDFVGSCINMASRLQKLPGMTFAFNLRGFDLESDSPIDFFTKEVLSKKMSVRGIGDHELVVVTKEEFENAKPEDQFMFKDPES